MMNYLLVGLGGAIGSILRVWVSSMMFLRLGSPFPWGTLLVNFSGSFLIGLLAVVIGEGRGLSGDQARSFLMAGILGGFTTFSTFSLQTLNLARANQWSTAFLYAFASLALCLVGVFLGHSLGQWISPPKP